MSFLDNTGSSMLADNFTAIEHAIDTGTVNLLNAQLLPLRAKKRNTFRKCSRVVCISGVLTIEFKTIFPLPLVEECRHFLAGYLSGSL